MVNFITKANQDVWDRNGKHIDVGSECLFMREGNIGKGQIIGYTNTYDNVYIISGSFGTVTTYKRLCKNVVIVDDLSKWNHKQSGWR